MSNMIPRRVIDTMRHQVDVSLNAYGIDCTLYIPTTESFNAAEKKDVFSTPDDYEYLSYAAKVFIEWQPSTYRLKKLGMFVEGNLPILAWFGNKAIALEGSEAGAEVDIDVVRHSYFRMTPEFIPGSYVGVEEFEIVNQIIKNMHDAVILQGFSIAPRRVQI